METDILYAERHSFRKFAKILSSGGIMKRTFIALLSAVAMLFATNCYGGFVVTRKLYNWNGGLGNKWVKSIVMWVMIIIPVYPIVSLVDLIVLNTLEFWTGSNPMAMKEGDVEIQLVEKDGKQYEITATRNQFAIAEIANGQKKAPVYLMYRPEETAWYVKSNGKTTKISEAMNADATQVKLFHPDGKSVEVRL
jgi:hypothetical protein